MKFRSNSSRNRLFFLTAIASLLALAVLVNRAQNTALEARLSLAIQSPSPTISSKFDLSNSDSSSWHRYHNTTYNLSLQLPQGINPYVNNKNASGRTPATGDESYAWLEWDREIEPKPLTGIVMDSTSIGTVSSLQSYITTQYRIKGGIIPPSNAAYDLFADTKFKVLEFSQLTIDNHESWYLSIEPFDEAVDGYNNRFGAGEYLFVQLDPGRVLRFYSSTELNFDPHMPILMAISKTINFD